MAVVPDLIWKVGDTVPWPTMTARDATGAVVLTGLTLRFIMRRGTEGKVNRLLAGSELVDLPNGQWRFEPAAADVDTPGDFDFELEVTDTNDKIATFPQGPRDGEPDSRPYYRVRFYKDLGSAPPPS